MNYHVAFYNCFDLLHFKRLNYNLALNTHVRCVWSRLKSFYLMPEDIHLLSLLPISNIFEAHVTYSVSRDNCFTRYLLKDWILKDYS